MDGLFIFRTVFKILLCCYSFSLLCFFCRIFFEYCVIKMHTESIKQKQITIYIGGFKRHYLASSAEASTFPSCILYAIFPIGGFNRHFLASSAEASIFSSCILYANFPMCRCWLLLQKLGKCLLNP